MRLGHRGVELTGQLCNNVHVTGKLQTDQEACVGKDVASAAVVIESGKQGKPYQFNKEPQFPWN